MVADILKISQTSVKEAYVVHTTRYTFNSYVCNSPTM
nr:MAG TPA: hypothetical protein [Caudoviricetes sp.]DAV93023.1 MAG TPA: hypothetical protein [Bacteriophage sp.]